MDDVENPGDSEPSEKPTAAIKDLSGPIPGPVHVVCMGVSGCGKSTVARALESRLAWPFKEGDDLHPAANKEKMSSGIPLDDNDRAPWLGEIAAWLSAQASAGCSTISTCSALKRSYRDHLRTADGTVVFIHLDPPRAVLEERMQDREGHFMPASLLDSQMDTLEALEDHELGLICSDTGQLEELVGDLVRALKGIAGAAVDS